jgi:hypothetical protein
MLKQTLPHETTTSTHTTLWLRWALVTAGTGITIVGIAWFFTTTFSFSVPIATVIQLASAILFLPIIAWRQKKFMIYLLTHNPALLPNTQQLGIVPPKLFRGWVFDSFLVSLVVVATMFAWMVFLVRFVIFEQTDYGRSFFWLVYGFLTCVAIGAIQGRLQVPVLRQLWPNTRGWIWSNILAWTLVASVLLVGQWLISRGIIVEPNMVIQVILLTFFALFTGGAITGFALERILKQNAEWQKRNGNGNKTEVSMPQHESFYEELGLFQDAEDAQATEKEA